MSDSNQHIERLNEFRGFNPAYDEALDGLLEQLETLQRTTYPATPVDALLSDLWGTFVPLDSEAGMLAYGEFCDRVAIFRHELETSNPATDDGAYWRAQGGVPSPASEPDDDGMMLRHMDGTPYMDVRDYHAQRGDPPRLRYGDSNQESRPE